MPIQNASWYIYLGLFQPISVTCCILNRNQLFHFYWESNYWFLSEIQYRVEMDWFDKVKPSFLRAQFMNYHLIKMWKLEIMQNLVQFCDMEIMAILSDLLSSKWKVSLKLSFKSLTLTLPFPIPDEEKKLTQNFLFTLLRSASKVFTKAEPVRPS